MTMNQLLFFNHHASDDLRRTEALMLAYRLDNEFTRVYKAQYQGAESYESAISKMTEVLMREGETIETLSDVVDACYKFRDE